MDEFQDRVKPGQPKALGQTGTLKGRKGLEEEEKGEKEEKEEEKGEKQAEEEKKEEKKEE